VRQLLEEGHAVKETARRLGITPPRSATTRELRFPLNKRCARRARHHSNGDPHDNRLDNLKLLCPNCHSQTDTFAAKKRPAQA
jgi:hypothetical protein